MMATLHGRVDSYDNIVPDRRMVSDKIILADVFDRTTIDILGLNNESKFRFVNEPQRQYEWLEDTFVPVTDTLTGSGGLAADSTTTTGLFTTPKLYQVGMVILIDAEQIWVSAVDTSTGQLTLVRNRGGTQATHANSATVTIVGTARLEGADSDNSPSTEVTSQSNFSQIFQREIEISRSDKKFPSYGIADPEDYMIEMRMKELVQELNKLPYRGVKQAGSSAHTQGRGAGGFSTFITTNITAAGSVALNRSHIDVQLQAAFDAGGVPTLLFCNSFQQRRINSLYEDMIRTEREERVGGHRIQWLENPIGGPDIQIVVDRHAITSEVWLIDPRYTGYLTIDAFFYEKLAKNGDAERGEVVGEYGFALAFEKAHAGITGLTTS